MKSIEIESLGELKPHADIPEWLISQPKPIPFFDNKEFEFILDGDVENDKSFLCEANEAITNFLRINSNKKQTLSIYIFKNYCEVQDNYKFAENQPEALNLKDENDLWKHVYPSEIYVIRRNWNDKDIYISIHCECEWEAEHGLQLVFRRGLKLTRVSQIDGHLTEADAYDKPDSEDEFLSKF